MIVIEHISKSFHGKKIIEDISHVFETGKTNLIIGTSGSGKTVLQRCMVGLLTPDTGKIMYGNVSFTDISNKERKEIRRDIGMLFQGAALFDSKTVQQNVMFPLDMFTNLNYNAKLKRVNEVLDKVELNNVNSKYPSEISGGMKKRVGIARAIVLNPKYLFCDEPNSGLDPQTSLVIDKLIQSITVEYGMTAVVNTHDMNSVMEIGDTILYMSQGKKEWVGNKNDIIFSDNKKLNDFIFASDFAKDGKKIRMLEETGVVSPQELTRLSNDADDVVHHRRIGTENKAQFDFQKHTKNDTSL